MLVFYIFGFYMILLILTIIVLLMFTPLSFGIISCSGNNKSNSKLKEELNADFLPPILSVAALGQLSPSGEIRKLAAPISQFGSSPRITELLVNEGDFVKKGDVDLGNQWMGVLHDRSCREHKRAAICMTL